MVGIKSMRIIKNKFMDVLEAKKDIDRELYKLAHTLSI